MITFFKMFFLLSCNLFVWHCKAMEQQNSQFYDQQQQSSNFQYPTPPPTYILHQPSSPIIQNSSVVQQPNSSAIMTPLPDESDPLLVAVNESDFETFKSLFANSGPNSAYLKQPALKMLNKRTQDRDWLKMKHNCALGANVLKIGGGLTIFLMGVINVIVASETCTQDVCFGSALTNFGLNTIVGSGIAGSGLYNLCENNKSELKEKRKISNQKVTNAQEILNLLYGISSSSSNTTGKSIVNINVESPQQQK